jgi:enamine deaminase RidA (YjgF/YER057c/UK114 family)
MAIKRISSGAPWEETVGYCRALQVGPNVFVSGTAPIGKDQKIVAPNDAYLQTKCCLEIVKEALGKLDCPISAVVRTRMYVTDISRWAEFGRAHQEFFGEFPPTTSMIEVNKLIDPDMLIEIEVDAILTEQHLSISSSKDQEFRTDSYVISTNRSRLSVDTVHSFLAKSYWAANRSRNTIIKSIENSLCYGVYFEHLQVGFARVVTDYSTFGYLCDVYIDEKHRGNGLSKWLVDCILKHPDLTQLRRFILATNDAHSLYEKYGFKSLTDQEQRNFMSILKEGL